MAKGAREQTTDESDGLQVILTHEHTDFDALASLFAASLLHPHAKPVLPLKLNRNVRNFLALYRNQFPFLQPKDLPKERVTRAILVDTRAANWTKGMDKRTRFYIIDHHSLHAELPAGYSAWTEEVGANTTMLVEKLMAREERLSPVQATLLALGIHEDTGSLTYASTNHRDARALAWLLEARQGANLAVISQFLAHPLSEEQRVLLDQLIDKSEFIEVAGHTIVVAQAAAPEFQDEISALASRLMDFHETAALFLVIHLGDMVQVVARSTTDDIDVGHIARELGGGGHPRAAAAPIHGRETTTAEIRDRIVALARDHSRNAVTVRTIMSAGRPQSLAPDMPVAEATKLMQRWGHEGFPVLAKDSQGQERVLGVLTRREADRAMTHNMGDQPVRRFMRAGEVTVHPEDSINTLRRQMIESNWGQIPVVDEQGAVMGIVTRTDLIKLWDEASLPGRDADMLAAKLREVLSPTLVSLLELVGREVDRMTYTVYIVGGFVRDLLLNGAQERNNLDLDIVIEGNAIAFAERMQEQFGGRIVPHGRFRTAKWLLNDPEHPVDWPALFAKLDGPHDPGQLPPHLDFVTARTEFYTAPTALPTVESSSIKLDLHRRDFTINTMALCLNPDRWGVLLDSYGGRQDLNQGVVRVLHSLSFVDDPTRILRAVRYEQRFDFRIEPRTLELLGDALDLLEDVSPARIRHELERILQEREPEQTFRRLAELTVLQRIDPALVADEWIAARFKELRAAWAAAQPDGRLATVPLERLYWGVLTYRLPADADARLVDRLGLRRETQQLVEGMDRLRESLPTLRDRSRPPSVLAAALDRTDPDARALLRVLQPEPVVLQVLDRYETDWQHVRAALDGNDLRALGLPRGPIYGQVLAELRARRRDGQITSRAEEIAYVTDLVQEL